MQNAEQRQTKGIDFRDKHVAVIGMGVTGCSSASFLLKQGAFVTALDTKPFEKQSLLALIFTQTEEVPTPSLAELSAKLEAQVLTASSDLNRFDYVVLSPGVNPKQAAIIGVKQRSKIISDLDIFAAFNTIPCIGVTGSNGKSTVVDMLHQSLNASGVKALLGGNFGTGALDLLGQDADYIVLELSSFQLDITQHLPLEVACILNVTEDHIDRHETFAAYKKAKQAIFAQAKYAVVNVDDSDTFLPSYLNERVHELNHNATAVRAQVSARQAGDQSLNQDKQIFSQDAAGIYLNGTMLVSSQELRLAMPHMMLNMQFVLAILLSLGLPLSPALKALKNYEGLAHRFQVIHDTAELKCINDSKATNPGACLAALSCAHQLGWQIVLLAGGDAKGADLSTLKEALNTYVAKCFVFGKDADKLAALFSIENQTKCEKTANLSEATRAAFDFVKTYKKAPVAILLSPACASTDMFKNYIERGEQFTLAVQREAA